MLAPRRRHRFHRTRAGVVAGLTVAVSACAGSGDPAPVAADEADDAERTDGAALYAAHCASCHGDDLRGTETGPSQLSVVYEPGHHGDDSYRRAIADGTPQHHWNFGDMAPVPGLSEDQVDQIIAFIRSVQEREGFEPSPP